VSLPTPFYQDASCTIYNADCREILPLLPRFDLLLTDPPYGINADNQKRILSRGKLANPIDYGQSDWDKEAPVQTVHDAIDQADFAIVWGGNYFGLPASSCWLVWDKDNGSNDFADCELAWTNLRKAVRKFKYRWNGMLQEHGGDKKEVRVHPTQKPVPLLRFCLTQCLTAQTILDPFMGSGTTLVAAKLEGRRAVGIEISEKYCELAANRLRQKVLNFEEATL
jgi:DNA modification methylase